MSEETVVTSNETPVQEQAPEKTKFRKEIDLGDGSGVQVFEADTPEELIEKLAEAQKHATAKIRQLNKRLKRQSIRQVAPDVTTDDFVLPEPRPRQLSADELFLLSQEIQTNPDRAFDRLLQAKLGLSPDELRQLIAKMATLERQRQLEQQQVRIAQEFVEAHPEYVPCDENRVRIERYLRSRKLDFTREALEEAYEFLQASGLLVTKTQPETAEPARIEQRKPKNVGMSAGASNSAPPAPPSPEEVVEELYSVPLEKLRERIQREHLKRTSAIPS